MIEKTWSLVGFYLAPDHARREWQVVGTKLGLSMFPELLRRVARSDNKCQSIAVHSNRVFKVREWDRPGIDDAGLYGPADDLKRLAALIDGFLANVEEQGAFRIDSEYAPDVEYCLSFRLAEKAFASGFTENQIETAQIPGTDWEPFALSPLQFSFYDNEWEADSEGQLWLTENAILMEYLIKEDDDDDELRKSRVREHVIPISELASVDYKGGLVSTLVTLRASSLKTFDGLPSDGAAEMTLRFKKKARAELKRMVEILESMLTQ